LCVVADFLLVFDYYFYRNSIKILTSGPEL